MFGKKKKTQKTVKRHNPRANISHSETSFATAEAFKTIRTNLMFTTPVDGCKRVLVTSSVPDEGKTTVCGNLGIAIAQMNDRVLLIDCDLRAPTLHRFFQAKALPGLSEILAGMKKAEEVILTIGSTTLDILPAGTIPPNPAELLGGPQMDSLLDELSKRYDYILLDTPPLAVVSDALNLTSKVRGTVVVTREGFTEHKQLKKALDALSFANAEVLGLILNGSKGTKGAYGYYGSYGQYSQKGQFAKKID